jgi:serine/threonine-protein kinase
MAGAGYLVAALVLFPSPLLPNERQVTRVIGLSEEQARRELTQAGLAVEIAGTEPHPVESAGLVIWQDPAGGTAVPRGSVVALTLSGGPPRVMVPDVRGFDLDLAQRLIKAAGLVVGVVDSVDEKGLMSGFAVATEPAARDSLLMGRSVTIHLSR